MSIEHSDIEPHLEGEIFIADNNTGSRKYEPKKDAQTHWEMEDDPNYQDIFGERFATDLQEKELTIEPSADAYDLKELLDINEKYASIYERPITQTTEQGSEMIGWVRLYRTNKERLKRFYKEGLLEEKDEKYPVLEIAYAKHKNKPKNVMDKGVAAELFRIYDLAKEKDPDLEEEGLSYNGLCKLRIIATVEQDLTASKAILDKLGFTERGSSAFYIEGEAYFEEGDDEDPVDVYELDWDKFMQGIDKEVIRAATQRTN